VSALEAADIVAIEASWSHLSGHTRYLYGRALRRLLRDVAPQLASLPRPVVRPEPRVMVPTADEKERLLATKNLGLRFVLLACSHAGLRASTAFRLAPKDIQEGYIVRHSKRGTVVRVPVSPELAEVMASVPYGTEANSSSQFVTLLTGKVCSGYSTLWQWFRVEKLRLGISSGITMHDFRRGLARALYKTTGDLRQVQSMLGHSSLKSTVGYLQAANRPISLEALQGAIDETNKAAHAAKENL
jgi:integrase